MLSGTAGGFASAQDRRRKGEFLLYLEVSARAKYNFIHEKEVSDA